MSSALDTEPIAKNARSSSGFGWKTAVGILISGVLLYYAFRGQPLGDVVAAIRDANVWLLLLATGVATSVFWIRAWRWRAILDPVRRGTSFHSRFAAVNIGFMANNVLPARAGELLRPYVLSRLEPVPMVAALSSLLIERLFDALTLVAMLFVTMSLPGLPPWPANAEMDFPGIARRIGLVMGLGGLVLFLLVLWPRPTVRAFEAIANRILPGRFRRPVIDALEAFLAGASVLRSGRLLVEVGAWSIVLWIVNAAGFWIAAHAFGIDVSFVAMIFFNSCLAFVVAVPAAPGFVGTFELAHVLVLSKLWGFDQSTVLGYALGFHIAAFIPITLMGLYYANRLGLSLSGASKVGREMEEAVEEATGKSTTT